MPEELRLKLANALPDSFALSEATDFPEEGFSKVRGAIGSNAILIEYDYRETPDTVILETIDINQNGKRDVCPIDSLGAVLATLS